jgi:hypothetical protein
VAAGMTPRLLWAFAALLTIAAVVVWRAPSGSGRPPVTMLRANGSVPSPTADRTAPAPLLPVWHRRVRRSVRGSPDASARDFLDSYLVVSYGHAAPRALRGATAALRARYTRFPLT